MAKQIDPRTVRRERLARYTTWTRQDQREFDEALRALRTIDPALWA